MVQSKTVVERTLSPSQKRAWLDCRGKWDYGYREGLVPVEPPQERLTVGKYLHSVLRQYHTEPSERRSHAMLMEDLERTWDSQLSETSRKKAVNILNTFWNTLGKDEEVPPLGTEQELSVMLPNAVRAHGFLDDLHVDHVNQLVTIGELKTGEDPDEDFYVFFNPQVYDYAWMASKQWVGYNIQVRHTLLSTAKAVRRVVPVEPSVLLETEQEWLICADEIYGHPLPIVYNRTMRCARGCPYYLLCLLRGTGGDVEDAKRVRYAKKGAVRLDVEQEVENV